MFHRYGASDHSKARLSMKISPAAFAKGFLFMLLITLSSCQWFSGSFESDWDKAPDRVWAGPFYWANRLQDWRIHNGRLECIDSRRPLRTLHHLTRTLEHADGKLRMSIETGLLSDSARDPAAYAGFLLGAGSLKEDYRMRSLIHQAHGENGGLIAAVNGLGNVILLDNENKRKPWQLNRQDRFSDAGIAESGVRLNLLVTPVDENYHLTLYARELQSGQILDSATLTNFDGERLLGNIALAAHNPDTSNNLSFWFNHWKMKGSMLEVHKEHRFGPILAAHYTLSRNSLQMTAQLPPLAKKHLQPVRLEISRKGKKWKEVAQARITTPGWTASFRIKDWNSRHDWLYRLSYPLNETGEIHRFQGTIPKEPPQVTELAALQNNRETSYPMGNRFNFSPANIDFPHQEMIQNLKQHRPHMILFAGNQVRREVPVAYEGDRPEKAYLDYLYRWYLFCWAYGELTKDLPSVLLPGPQDFYQDSLWGGTEETQSHQPSNKGGYQMPAPFVNMVQRTQTGHLPEPYDPSPNNEGIPAFYTDMLYGGIHFALLEGRKFKSPPPRILEQANTQPGNRQEEDNARLTLYGERQLEFLRHWAEDWNGVHIKAVLSDAAPACIWTQSQSKDNNGDTSQVHSALYNLTVDPVKAKDQNTNGWPPEGRDAALRIIRKAHAPIITGGENPSHVVQHGIQNWKDAIYSYGIPPLYSNGLRGWYISDTSRVSKNSISPFTGNFQDGFGNHVSLRAIANPYIPGPQPNTNFNKGAGYGMVRFDKYRQRITFTSWPAQANPENNAPFPGWPVSLKVEENYRKPASMSLPQILTQGLGAHPVFKVYPANGDELVYARRAADSIFQPPAVNKTFYNIVVGCPEENKLDTLRNLKPVQLKKHIILDFSRKQKN
jgi:hypothetical protein